MIFVILLVILLVFAIASLRIVPEAQTCVIQRFGRYHATWGPGVHFLVPVMDSVAKKISMKEQVADFEPQPVITEDNVTMQIDTVVYFKIFDPQLFTYGVERPITAIENLCATTLRNIVGGMDLDSTLTGRDTINGEITQILDEATDKWGIKINRVEVKNIMPPREIQESMEKQMRPSVISARRFCWPRAKSRPPSPVPRVKRKAPFCAPMPPVKRPFVRHRARPRPFSRCSAPVPKALS